MIQYPRRAVSDVGDTGSSTRLEDPYTEAARIDREGNLDVGARLEQARHRDGSIAEGAPAWVPPQRPLLRVITALRDDPLGRMFARRQIDRAQFDAGKEYRSVCDAAESSPACARSIRRRPASMLRSVDEALTSRFGSEANPLKRTLIALCYRLGATLAAGAVAIPLEPIPGIDLLYDIGGSARPSLVLVHVL
jgi:hypothetical protein